MCEFEGTYRLAAVLVGGLHFLQVQQALQVRTTHALLEPPVLLGSICSHLRLLGQVPLLLLLLLDGNHLVLVWEGLLTAHGGPLYIRLEHGHLLVLPATHGHLLHHHLAGPLYISTHTYPASVTEDSMH